MHYRLGLCILAIFFLIGGKLLAGDFIIPVCQELDEASIIAPEEFGSTQLQVEKLLKAEEWCKAAVLVKGMQLTATGVGKDVLLGQLLKILYAGKYLNDFTKELMLLKEQYPEHQQMELWDYWHVSSYFKHRPKKGTNPLGQLVKNNLQRLTYQEEVDLVSRHFLEKYSQSQYRAELETKLLEMKEQEWKKEILDFSSDVARYSKLKRPEDIRFYQKKFVRTLRVIKNSHVRPEAIWELLLSFFELSKLDEGEQARQKAIDLGLVLIQQYADHSLAKKAHKLFKKEIGGRDAVNLEQVLSSIVPLESEEEQVIAERERVVGPTTDDLVAEIQRKKGKDTSLFLPLKVLRGEQVAALVALGVTGILIAFDRPLTEWVQESSDNPVGEWLADFGNNFGEQAGLGPVIGGSLALGLVFRNDKLKRAAWRSLGAVLLGQIVVQVLKALTHRARPDETDSPYVFDGPDWDPNNTSFASGHSAGAWAVATIFATEFADSKIVPIVAYTLAALTSYARVHKDRHWVSDVFLGAAIGYISGKIMSKLFRKTHTDKGRFILAPRVGHENGISLIIRDRQQEHLRNWALDYFAWIFTQNSHCQQTPSPCVSMQKAAAH